MRLMFVATLFCFGLAGSLSAQAPQMNNVQPEGGKIGSVLRIHGLFLDKTKVDEVYLTDHTFDMKVKVLDQKDDVIEFRIPPSVKPGKRVKSHSLTSQPNIESPRNSRRSLSARPWSGRTSSSVRTAAGPDTSLALEL